ncbi:tetratricopeptide repeat protein [Lacinutrix sp.]|uniref:tetratricopeptide repeat protein n=1 Tax=Lacinutrix sp. TaxID=1937692 RepID=UPI0025C2A183|nr:tetratricopeptide repeat protein [Lacinutrix sp.]
MKNLFALILALISTVVLAQDKSDKIVTVGYDACECIGEIDLKLDYEGKSKAINSCIESANSSYQLLNKLTTVSQTLKENEATKDSINAIKKEVNITIYTNEDVQEIRDYLLETCGDMESIYFSSNKTTRKSYSKNEKALKQFSLGIEAGEAQDYEKALKHYKKAVAIDKKFAFAWDNLGITYRLLNKNKEAVEAYKKSLKLDAKGKIPLMNIGVAYEKLGEYDNAIKYYNKYKKIYKKDPEAPYGLGRMYFENKQYMQAVDNMMQAYILYIEIESPYKKDAEANLKIMYQALKAEDKLDIFKAAAKKNKIDL